MIRLFTRSFPVKDTRRRGEFLECLRRNLACAAIDEVCVFGDPGWKEYGIRPAAVLRREVYLPYIRVLSKVGRTFLSRSKAEPTYTLVIQA